jgi:hypothetical protein
MHSRGHRWDWAVSCAFFAAILLALVIAAIMQNPWATTIP